MEHVKDDMDELFRRAADGYPLNTDSADWNDVVKKLSSDKSVSENTSTKNKKYKHLLWLLLLLPLGVYKIYVSNTNTSNKSLHIIAKNILNKKLSDTSLSGNVDTQSNAANSITVLPKKSLVVINSSGIQRKTKGKLNLKITENTASTFLPGKTPSLKVDPVNESYKETGLVSEQNNKKEIDKNENKETVIKVTDDNKKVDGTIKNNEKKITQSSQKKMRKQQEHGLYAGIFISPDISTVKFQSIKNIGISMGLILGYQINKKISIESGALWSIKNYYSDGKYFSTKNIRLPYGAKIKNIDGICNMIEVPLTIKYNLTTGKTNFSISAGLSSYFMKKEKYDYAVDNNGQQYQYPSTYKNSSTNLLSVVNFNVGYNRAFNRNISLRIEPYIKIPLKGMGIGSLPIMSSGFNIGITKKLY